ncbi:SsrA-binding protein SmpB [Patescibacteria group bacterium]|nr:SsrA-binding protein SmpB [Patescibacteria group bacterium]
MKIISRNKKAFLDYKIVQKFEAGIILSGPEVKSIKKGRVNLTSSYVSIDRQNNVHLLNAHIAPYPPATQEQKKYNPTQSRKLLLHKKEIKKIQGKINTPGWSVIPLQVYLRGGIIKVEIATVQGRKKYDKREVIKQKELKRRIDRALKNSFR